MFFPEYILYATHMPGASAGRKRVLDLLNWNHRCFKPQCRCWKLNTGLLREQQCSYMRSRLSILENYSYWYLFYILPPSEFPHTHPASDILILSQNISLAMREHTFSETKVQHLFCVPAIAKPLIIGFTRTYSAQIVLYISDSDMDVVSSSLKNKIFQSLHKRKV